MKISYKIICLLVLTFIMTMCLTTRYYSPHFLNGYAVEVIVKIEFEDGNVLDDKFSPNQSLVMMSDDQIFKSITIFDSNRNLIASYPPEYLDNLREKCGGKKEGYIIYEGGLVLISENCPLEDDLKTHLEKLKKHK